jgi:hypothetical protein
MKQVERLYARIERLLVPVSVFLVILAIVVYALDVWLR